MNSTNCLCLPSSVVGAKTSTARIFTCNVKRAKFKVLPKQPEEWIESGSITCWCLKSYQVTHCWKTGNKKSRNIPPTPVQPQWHTAANPPNTTTLTITVHSYQENGILQYSKRQISRNFSAALPMSRFQNILVKDAGIILFLCHNRILV